MSYKVRMIEGVGARWRDKLLTVEPGVLISVDEDPELATTIDALISVTVDIQALQALTNANVTLLQLLSSADVARLQLLTDADAAKLHAATGAMLASGTQQASISDASTAHSILVLATVGPALDALGAKINLILDALDAFGITA